MAQIRKEKCALLLPHVADAHLLRAWQGLARGWLLRAWRGVAWRGVAWRGVAWRGVAWRGVGVCA